MDDNPLILELVIPRRRQAFWRDFKMALPLSKHAVGPIAELPGFDYIVLASMLADELDRNGATRKVDTDAMRRQTEEWFRNAREIVGNTLAQIEDKL